MVPIIFGAMCTSRVVDAVVVETQKFARTRPLFFFLSLFARVSACAVFRPPSPLHLCTFNTHDDDNGW